MSEITPRVALVDDDPSLRQSLAEQLAPEYTATQAETGEAAIAAARQAHFDAILLDLGLPDLDGREVCRRLRENGVTHMSYLSFYQPGLDGINGSGV